MRIIDFLLISVVIFDELCFVVQLVQQKMVVLIGVDEMSGFDCFCVGVGKLFVDMV